MPALLVVLLLASVGTASAQVITNGSFESGISLGDFTTLSATNTTGINGWTVSAGEIDYIGTHWVAADGSRSLDMNGCSAGAISQTFSTGVGTQYLVQFALAGNPVLGTQVTTLRASAASTAVDFTFNTSGKTTSNMGWEEKSFTFTASNSSTTLSFASVGTGHHVCTGPALDNVRVTAAVGTVTVSHTSSVIAGDPPVDVSVSNPINPLHRIAARWGNTQGSPARATFRLQLGGRTTVNPSSSIRPFYYTRLSLRRPVRTSLETSYRTGTRPSLLTAQANARQALKQSATQNRTQLLASQANYIAERQAAGATPRELKLLRNQHRRARATLTRQAREERRLQNRAQLRAKINLSRQRPARTTITEARFSKPPLSAGLTAAQKLKTRLVWKASRNLGRFRPARTSSFRWPRRGSFIVDFDETSLPSSDELEDAGELDDPDGEEGSVEFTEILDETPPVLIGLPGDETWEADQIGGAIVAWEMPTAEDDVDGSSEDGSDGDGSDADGSGVDGEFEVTDVLKVTCDRDSESFFPLGTTTVTCTAVDGVGNSTSGSFKITVEDTTPPVVTPTINPPPNSGWNKGAVTVSWTTTDPESGISSSNGCGPTTLTSETAGTQVTCTATDGAGLTTTQSATIRIDTTPPMLTASAMSGPASYIAGTWTKNDVVVTWACTDALSGVATFSGPTTVTAEGAAQSVPGECIDNAGNVSNAAFTPIKIDKTPPMLIASATSGGQSYVAGTWTNKDVVVTWACTDALSGVATFSGPTTVTAEGAAHSVPGECVDKVGHVSNAAFTPIKIDKTAPEAFNRFDRVTKTVQVFGRDAGSGVSSSPAAGACTPVKWGHGDDDGDGGDDDDDKENNAQRCTFKITDAAGNSVTLVEDVKSHGHSGDDDGKEIKVVVVSFQYSTGGVAGPVITPPSTSKKFEWSLNKDGSLKELEQKMTVGKGKDKQEVQAKFDSKKNQTEIKDKRGAKEVKVTKPGLVLLMLATDKNKLVIEF